MRFLTHSASRPLLAAVMLLMTSAAARAIQIPDSLFRYSAEVSASFSTGAHTPFWLVNNRFGLSSIEKNSGYVRAGLFHDAERRKDKRFSWGAGVDLAAAWNFNSPFIVQQLYADLRYRCLELSVGSKERSGGFENPRLSSGNLLFSTNARPIPQARLAIPDYEPLKFTNSWVSVKGYVAYGMFTDDKWQRDWARPGSKRTEDVLFHAKGGHLKFGDTARFPLTFEAGMEMGAQFGGKSYVGNKVIDMPSKLKDWIKVFIPSSGDSDTPTGEQTNIYGNHTGDWNFRLSWLPRDADWGASLYYDHFFEDHSMMFFDYEWHDMLLGLEVKLPSNPAVATVVYEYLYSKDQGSPVYWDHTELIPEQVSGRDDYYNHGIYTGWQHWGMGIGNPLLISPVYNKDNVLSFRHNRIKGHHLGLEGRPLSWLSYRLLLSYTRSWGSYNTPTPDVAHNFNALLETTFSPSRLKGWSATLSLASDGGAMLGPSFGTMLSIRKTGWL